MGLSAEEACAILGIGRGADEEEIRAAYKKLALKWHPDKHNNSDSATKKFQEVSAAYKRLTTDDPDNESEVILSPSEMFDLFARMFFHARFNDFYDSDDFDDGSDYSDEDFLNEDDDDLQFIHYLANNSGRGLYKNENVNIAKNRPSESEARKNAEELVKEEEKQRKQREKKKAKKKRQKEKRRLEKGTTEKAKNMVDSDEHNEETIAQTTNEPYIANENKYSERLKENGPSSKSQPKYTEKRTNSKENIEQNQQKTHKNKKYSTNKKQDSQGNSGQSDGEGQSWDTQSAFFARAAATATKKVSQPTTSKKKDKKSKDQGETIEGMDPIVLKSRKIAVKGNEMANQGLYTDAIQLFTEAINLDSKDFRFFGNRSFCYDRISQHDKALEDAKKAIQLNKEWPKGYFRKGRALAGLKLYSDAEAAFEHVLKLDKECDDAVQELIRVRTYQLIEMGFSRQQSETGIREFGSVQAALDSLLSGMVPQNAESDEEIYISDEEDYITQENKLDARNPEKLTSLWIGNVQPTVTEKNLQELFSQWGPVTSIRMLPEKYCAFVNFKSAVSASSAIEKLQGKDFHGRQLLIKFPDNPIVSGQPRTTIIRKIVKPAVTTVTTPTPVQKTTQKFQQPLVASNQSIVSEVDKAKAKGPVNGNECYFWRTTGCAFGDSCRYTHTPANKGVDRKPWQKPTV